MEFFKVGDNIAPNLNLVKEVDSNFLLYSFPYYLEKNS